MGKCSELPCFFFFFFSLLLSFLSAPHSCSQSQQSCDSSDLNALQGFVEGLQSSALGWSSNGSSSSNCCTWVGISCDLGSVSVKRVIGLDLSNKSLKGSVSPSLGGLDQLKLLNLSYNSLRGPVPVELFHLPHLELLDLSMNMLSGHIPADSNLSSIQVFNISFNSFNGRHPILARSSNLSVYDISSNSFSGPVDTGNNSLTGTIDLNFTALPRLEHLNLGPNFFSGRIPPDLPNCLQMHTLSLAGNNLVGEMPSSFKNFTSLVTLGLSSNNFSNLYSALEILQSLPNLTHLLLNEFFRSDELMVLKGIYGFPNLELLTISDCSISDSIPPWLANSSKLKFLDISWNRLTGTIPSWFGNLDDLFYLDLSSNSLTGEIPTSLTRMKSLAYGNSSHDIGVVIQKISSGRLLQYSSLRPSIILSNNKLVGSILPRFNDLVNLHVLDLSFNNISGTIPDLSGLLNLESLDLSHNHLIGVIPPSLSRLHFLSRFSVAYNNLSGKIPTGGQFDTLNDPSIYIGNYYLCGPPTKNNCPDGAPPNHYPKRHANSGAETMWLYLGMGWGFATGFWGVYVVFLFRRSWRIAYFQMTDKLFDDIYVMVVLSWRRLNEKIGGQRPIP